MAASAVQLGRATALVATLAAPFMLYLAGRNAAAAAGTAGAAAAAALPPPDYRAVIKGLARAAQNPQLPLGAEAMKLAQQAAVASPTNFESFFVAAVVEDRAGRLDRAIQLMEESRRRRPHHAPTRLQLILLYGKARRFEPLLSELDMALALNHQARTFILPELTRLMTDPAGRAALAGVLARGPEWREDFYRAARGRKVKPDDALALVRLVEARSGRPSRGARGVYLQSLLEVGEYRRARALWSASLPSAERAKDGLVFDGSFRGSPAPAPFNWSFHEGAFGRARIGSQPSQPRLELAYFGGQNFGLAEQNLALPPGRYRLSFLTRSEEGIKSGEINWRITCADGRDLGAVKVDPAGSAFVRREGRFEVPSGCVGQRLSLVGTPGDVSAEVRADVASVEITRDG